VEALTAVIRFVLGYYRKNPEFVTLLNTENLHKGRHIEVAAGARLLVAGHPGDHHAEILEAVRRREGVPQGLVARDIYLMIAATGYFYTSNRHTLSPSSASRSSARGDGTHWEAFVDRDGAAHRARRRHPRTRQQNTFHPTRGQHEMAEIAAGGKSGKVVITNIGLLLSGDIDRPILDADTIVVNDGLITAVGKAKDCDTSHARLVIDVRRPAWRRA
jgi:hypothetical protein